ncbi:MAG: hypothetical protein EXS16_10385, partial [Gemmataceae bacterium]|nr:hypothetical protein [Gemmataceae bacterium]
MFGWIGLTASYAFSAVTVGVSASPSYVVATPTFSPPAGFYATTQSVTIASVTVGAAIYYTTNGSTPTSSSTLYTGAISVTPPTTVKAIGILAGWTDSAVA